MGCPTTILSIDQPGPVINEVFDKIDSQMATAQAMGQVAQDAINNISASLGNLEIIDLPSIVFPTAITSPDTTVVDSVDVDIGEFVMPPAPDVPSPGGTTMPSVPDAPSLEIEEVDVDLDIDKPLALTAMLPSEPSLPAVAIPDSPAIFLPDVPSFSGVNVPAIPTIDLPLFTATLDDVPVAPDPSFNWTEVPYSSDLLTELQYWLTVWVAGAATGIDPDVERSIWDRGRDREAATFGQAATQVINDFAGRGFPMPPGAVAITVADAGMRMRSQVSTFNRDVAIKQAELEQQNRQFAIAKAWDVQQGLINYTSQQADRSLEAAKYVVEAAIEVYKAMVLRFNAQVEAFKARAEVFKAQLQGELAKLEVFKAQIEAARLTVELDKAQVDLYRAQIEAVNVQIEIYKGQIDAAQVQAEIGKTLIDGYKARVDAYKAQVDAKESEYKAYESEIRAETSKIEVFKARADVLNARANAYAATVKARTDLSALEVDINERIPLERFRERVNAFSSEVQAAAAQIDGNARAAASRVQAYAAEQQARVGMAGVDASIFDGEVRQIVGLTGAAIDLVKSQADVAIQRARERIEAVRSAAQVSATLAAGAMAGVNVHAGASGSASSNQSLGVSYGHQSNCSYSGDA